MACPRKQIRDRVRSVTLRTIILIVGPETIDVNSKNMKSGNMQTSPEIPTIILKGPSFCNQTALDPAGPIQARTIKHMNHHPVHDYRTLVQSSLTNKYYLAGTARSKLAYELEGVDLNLLRLVGHANVLDRLQDDIESAQKLHETRHQARVVRHSVSSKKGSIVWADSSPAEDRSDASDVEQASSDSEGEEEILQLARLPTRYQLPQSDPNGKATEKKVSSKASNSPQQVKVLQLSAMLPRIVEEDEEGEESVDALLRTFNRDVVVGLA